MDDRQVPPSRETFERFRNYHRLVLTFSKDALGMRSLPALLQQACECASKGTSVQRAKVLQYRPENDDLLIVAGIGWGPNVVGAASLSSAMRSPPGRAFRTGIATFIDNLPEHHEFDYSELLRAHGIVSLVNVPIAADNTVWGVLEVDSARLRRFDADDREFLCGFAEIIGRTIENRRQLERAEAIGLDRRIELEERETLFRELQHRIGNQLQLIIGALEIASQRTVDPAARKAIDAVIQRADSIAKSHQQLSLTRVENEVSLSAYLNRLLPSFGVPERITVLLSIEDLTVQLGTAVRLGLIVNELVTNSIKHAFGEASGHITIGLAMESDRGEAVLSVADDGCGIGATRSGGSGMDLIKTLTQQIGGTTEWGLAADKGTRFILRFRP